MSKELSFNSLVLLSLISFGIFGSLSHVFNSVLIFALTLSYFNSKTKSFINPSAKKLYFAISSVFFIFLIRGVFHTDTLASIESLSPMLPIPLIGLMILLTNRDNFSISATRLENYAKIAVITTFLIYLIFSKSLALKFGVTELFFDRLEIFSGNPIPFSTAVFGITVFCFCNWKHSKNHDKLIAIACLLIGCWLAGIASGARGTLLVIVISTPIFIWLMTQSFLLLLLMPVFILAFFWLLHINGVVIINNSYSYRLISGLDTFFNNGTSSTSVLLRLEMQSASLNTIKENLFWGYDISNRFTALSEHLPEAFKKHTHPHNDILASTIGAGLIGGLLSILSLLSPVWAALISKENTKEKLILAILVTLGILITANLNTVFFNDITAAWLAFSTFLIWNLNYSKELDQDDTI